MSATMNLNVAAIKFCDKNGGKTMKEVSKNAAAGPQYFGSIQFVDFYFSCEADLGRAQ